MTASELINHIKHGALIECKDAVERQEVMLFMQDAGFPVNVVSKKHLECKAEEDRDLDFLHPGLDEEDNHIVCFRSIKTAMKNGREIIKYDDVAELIAHGLYPEPPGEEEFTASLMNLLGVGAPT